MAVKEGNTRIIVTIPTELKENLDILCAKDKRTMSKEVEYIIEKYIEEIEKSKE